jgi:hypothetical protein
MKDKTLRQEVEDLRGEVQTLKTLVNQMAQALFDDGADYEEEEVVAYLPKPKEDLGIMFN